jgi:MFS family permease
VNNKMKTIGHNIQSTIRRYYIFNLLRQLAFFSAVLVPFFTQWGGITLLQVQLLQSWFALWLFLLEVPTGAVADFFGRKYSLALGGIVAAVGALIYGSVPRFEFFLLGEFLLAAGYALTSGADQALIYDSLVEAKKEHESKSVFARAHMFTLLGVMFSAMIGSVIAMKYGLNAPMLFTAIPFGLASLIALTLREPYIHQPVTESLRYIHVLRSGFSYFYHHRSLRLLAIDAVVVAAGGYFAIWLYQPILQKMDIPLYYFGIGHVLLTSIEILIAANFIRLEKLFGSGTAFFRYSALLTALPFFLVAIYPNLLTVGIFIAFSGGFGMTRIELMSSYMNKHILSGHRATVLSSVSMLRRFTLMILNPIVGLIASRSISLGLLFVGLLPFAVFLFSPITEKTLKDSNKLN